MKKLILSTGVVLAIAVGVIFGLGAYTFQYAQGLSYFSTDPKACMNCHIMNDQYNSWTKSSHHAVATCVQCHLPIGFVDKWIAKASNGYHHSKGFTLEDFHEPIMIKEGNRKILQENCVACHADMTHELTTGAGAKLGPVSCVHCHSKVGHGPK